MKRIIALILCLLLLSSCSVSTAEKEKKEEPEQKPENSAYVKAIWFPYYDLQKLTQGSDEKQFTEKIDNAFKELKDIGFNTVTVQVRPCADAFYKSSVFPSSEYCFGKQGADMPYDPLKIICSVSEKYSLSIEAWINPYRVSQENDIEALCDGNTAKKWYKNESTKSRVYVGKNKIFFNPASEAVIDLIVKGVAEIVQNYNISAIHFDDYFYPVTSKDIDEKEYAKYQSDGGKLNLNDYRRARVTLMIKRVYEKIKSINDSVRFGVSPAASIKNDYNTLYADVEKWVSGEGYVDYICPQVYFGFKNVYQPFMFTVKKWMYITSCDMYVGLPLYKAGKADKNAAKEDEAAINEFVNNNNIISRQITYLSKLDNIKGFYVFSYGSLKDSACQQEVKNMIAAMSSSNH